MSVHEVRTAVSAPPIPRPRTAEDAPVVRDPWRSAGGARPRTDYWDVTAACWRPCAPRSGD
jgi:hypothetical protein